MQTDDSKHRRLLLLSAAALVVFLVCVVSVKHSPPPAPSQQPTADKVRPHGDQTQARKHKAITETLPLRTARTILTVLDADGNTLSGAKVFYFFYGQTDSEKHETVTDEQGNASIFDPEAPEMRSGRNVFVIAEQHVPIRVSLGQIRPVPARYTVRLSRALTIAGWVVDASNLPVGGAGIKIFGGGISSAKIENITLEACPVTCGADGRWSYSHLPCDFLDEMTFLVNKPGGVASYVRLVNLYQADLKNLVLVLNEGPVVCGEVTDSGGWPVRDAAVSLVTGNSFIQSATTSDESGRFFLRCPAPTSLPRTVPRDDAEIQRILTRLKMEFPNSAALDSLQLDSQVPNPTLPQARISVHARGYAARGLTVELTGPTNLIIIALSDSRVLRGRVVTDAGVPIPRVLVRPDMYFESISFPQFTWETRTDSEGRFEWDSAPLEECRYRFAAEGYLPLEDRELIADGREHRIVLMKRSSPAQIENAREALRKAIASGSE